MFAKHQITQPWNQTHHPPRNRHKENPTLKEYITRKPRIPQHFRTIGEALAVTMKVIAVEGLLDKEPPKWL